MICDQFNPPKYFRNNRKFLEMVGSEETMTGQRHLGLQKLRINVIKTWQRGRKNRATVWRAGTHIGSTSKKNWWFVYNEPWGLATLVVQPFIDVQYISAVWIQDPGHRFLHGPGKHHCGLSGEWPGTSNNEIRQKKLIRGKLWDLKNRLKKEFSPYSKISEIFAIRTKTRKPGNEIACRK